MMVVILPSRRKFKEARKGAASEVARGALCSEARLSAGILPVSRVFCLSAGRRLSARALPVGFARVACPA